jgi:hypothetical protein
MMDEETILDILRKRLWRMGNTVIEMREHNRYDTKSGDNGENLEEIMVRFS